jgi:hypothetical protein
VTFRTVRAQIWWAANACRFGGLHIEIHAEPATLVILGRTPTAKRDVKVAAGNTVEVGDVTVDEQSK